LSARGWLFPALICFDADLFSETVYTHNTVTLKSLSGKITPKTNLPLSPEFDGRAGEPGDKASWLVEDWGWLSKPGLIWNLRHTTNTSSWTNIPSTQRKSLPQPLLHGAFSSLGRAYQHL